VRALSERGRADDAVAMAEKALVGTPAGTERGQLLLAKAFAHLVRGDLQFALRAGVDACELFEKSGQRAALIDGLSQNASTLRAAGDHATAMSMLEQAESLTRELDDPLRTARVLRQIGVVSSILGRDQHALSCLTQAVSLATQHADPSEVRNTRLSLLNAHSRRTAGLADEAAKREAAQAELADWAALAQACEAAGQTRLALMSWGNHAIVLQPAGRTAEAVQALRGLVPRYRENGMRPNEGLAHAELGRCHESLGETGLAREHFRQALALIREGGMHDDLIASFEGLARCEEALGDVAAALAALKELRLLEKKRTDNLARQTITQRELRVELARLTNQWARQATQDSLTGLANRRGLEAWLQDRWPRVERGRLLALVLLDLDHFKQVNDRHGHHTGDAVLVAVARLLEAHGRGADLAVRYGGEEFLLALDDTDLAGAHTLAQRLRQTVADHPWVQIAPQLAVTTSIGVADAGESLDVAGLLTLADKRLYAAKFGGRNRVVAEG